MKDKIKVASIQLNSSDNVEINLHKVETILQKIMQNKDIDLVVLPEYFALITKDDKQKQAIVEDYKTGKIQQKISQLAQQYQIYIAAGSIPLKSKVKNKVYNSCLVFAPSGDILGRYDKIHLFNYSNPNEAYCESDTIIAGKNIVVLDLPIGRIGIAICYDLRFAELFRKMDNVDMIVLPAAFTRPTGQAHWEVLCRARAIENQCYFIASAQTGEHAGGRQTFGHSMIIDPWGEIIEQIGDGEGAAIAELDFARMHKIRQQLPALQNRKIF